MTKQEYEHVCSYSAREQWMTARRSGIGASEIAAILGQSPWADPLSVFVNKTSDVGEVEQNEAMEIGIALEKSVADLYSARTGRPVKMEGILLRSHKHPWAIATLDATTIIDGDMVPLEIKTAGGIKADEWEDGPPKHYALQCQHQMLVTGANKMSVACLLGSFHFRLIWCDIERDERVIKMIERAGAAFWQNVTSGRPPEPTGTEASKRALSVMYPVDDGSTVHLGARLAMEAATLDALKDQRKAIDADILRYENSIRAAMGSATRAVFDDGSSFTLKTQHRKEYTVKPSTTRVLRRVAAKGDKQ